MAYMIAIALSILSAILIPLAAVVAIRRLVVAMEFANDGVEIDQAIEAFERAKIIEAYRRIAVSIVLAGQALQTLSATMRNSADAAKRYRDAAASNR